MHRKTTVLFCCIVFMAGTSAHAQTVSVSATKMNVLYIGVDNPVSVFCEGVSQKALKVRVSGGKLKKLKKDQYSIRVKTPGEVVLTVSDKQTIYNTTRFIAKRIPDPLPALGARYTRSDTLSPGLFKAQGGIALLQEDFDFEVKCTMIEYKVTLIGTYNDSGAPYIRSASNHGVRFGKQALEVMSEAVPGDIVLFSDFKAQCPGDTKDRRLNALFFFMEYTPDD